MEPLTKVIFKALRVPLLTTKELVSIAQAIVGLFDDSNQKDFYYKD